VVGTPTRQTESD